ncbi:MAG: hypothetical protein LBN95_03585 [Prevotellaceae bacterium]|jgi:hypothetical protein|nr:hypothetical protein [Prevotellaceae bacterium]
MRITGCIPTECTENVILNFYRAIHSYGMMSFAQQSVRIASLGRKNRNIDLHSVGMQP